MAGKIYNTIDQVEKAFGDVPAAFGSLIDLGSLYPYTGFSYINECDTDIQLQLKSGKLITMKAGFSESFDNLLLSEVIEYKYLAAPTSGFLLIKAW